MTATSDANSPLRGLRICICTPDFVYLVRNGGIGTSFAHTATELTRAGAEVTILYANDYRELTQEQVISATNAVAADGCRLEFLFPHDSAEVYENYQPSDVFTVSSYLVYRALKERAFDIIIFPDWRGLAYYSVHAKRLGLAFQATQLWIQAHSTALWHELNNQRDHFDETDVRIFHYERKSIELCDRLLPASDYLLAWMREHAFKMPTAVGVQPYLINPERFPAARRVATDIRTVPEEIVFFGRLERRKGLHLFTEALQRLAIHHADEIDFSKIKVTFLGKIADVDGTSAVLFIEHALDPLGIKYRYLPTLDADEAIAYLSSQPALAIMPSLTDNSPLTVHECINSGVPFLAASTGGIPEIVHPDDHASFLVPASSPALAARLLEVMRDGMGVARPAVNRLANREAWIKLIKDSMQEATSRPAKSASTPNALGRSGWLGRLLRLDTRSAGEAPVDISRIGPTVSICVTHYERPALLKTTLDGLASQTFTDFEIILVDNGSRTPAAANFLRSLGQRYPTLDIAVHHLPDLYAGAARNHALRHARAPFVVFMDDDNFAHPEQIRTFVEAMRYSCFDALSLVAALVPPEVDPSEGYVPSRFYLPAGSGLSLNLFGNSYGDANGIFRSEAIRAVGGFTEERLSWEDYELFSKLEQHGFRTGILPEPLLYLRESIGSVSRTGAMLPNYYRALRPALATFPWSTYGDALLVALGRALHTVGQITFLPQDDDGIRRVQQSSSTLMLGRALARRMVKAGKIDQAEAQLRALCISEPALELDLLFVTFAAGSAERLRTIRQPLAMPLYASFSVRNLSPLGDYLDTKAADKPLSPDEIYLRGLADAIAGLTRSALDRWAGMLRRPLEVMLAKYPDLTDAFGADNVDAALEHYILHGYCEGRDFYQPPALLPFAAGNEAFPDAYQTRRCGIAAMPPEEALRLWLPVLIANGAVVALADFALRLRERFVDTAGDPILSIEDLWPER